MKRTTTKEGAAQAAPDLPALVAEFFALLRHSARLERRMEAAREAIPDDVKRLRQIVCCAQPLSFAALRPAAHLTDMPGQVKEAWETVARANGTLTPEQRREIRVCCRSELNALRRAWAQYEAHPAVRRSSETWERWNAEHPKLDALLRRIVNTRPRSKVDVAASLRVFRYMAREQSDGMHPLWRWGVTMAGALASSIRGRS